MTSLGQIQVLVAGETHEAEGRRCYAMVKQLRGTRDRFCGLFWPVLWSSDRFCGLFWPVLWPFLAGFAVFRPVLYLTRLSAGEGRYYDVKLGDMPILKFPFDISKELGRNQKILCIDDTAAMGSLMTSFGKIQVLVAGETHEAEGRRYYAMVKQLLGHAWRFVVSFDRFCGLWRPLWAVDRFCDVRFCDVLTGCSINIWKNASYGWKETETGEHSSGISDCCSSTLAFWVVVKASMLLNLNSI